MSYLQGCSSAGLAWHQKLHPTLWSIWLVAVGSGGAGEAYFAGILRLFAHSWGPPSSSKSAHLPLKSPTPPKNGGLTITAAINRASWPPMSPLHEAGVCSKHCRNAWNPISNVMPSSPRYPLNQAPVLYYGKLIVGIGPNYVKAPEQVHLRIPGLYLNPEIPLNLPWCLRQCFFRQKSYWLRKEILISEKMQNHLVLLISNGKRSINFKSAMKNCK